MAGLVSGTVCVCLQRDTVYSRFKEKTETNNGTTMIVQVLHESRVETASIFVTHWDFNLYVKFKTVKQM